MQFLMFLTPRLVLSAILLMGIWASSELMTRTAINQSGALAPLEVTVDQASFQWQDRTVTMRNMLIGRNGVGQFQADKVSLKLDHEALLDQRWVVLDGMMTNPSLVSDSGSAATSAAGASNLAAVLEQALAEVRQPEFDYNARPKLAIEPTWWQQIQDVERGTGQAGQHTLQALESLKTKWESQLADCRQSAVRLQEQVTAAQNVARQPNNPLRNDARLSLTQRVNELTQEILKIRGKIEQIQRAAAADLATVADTAASEIESLDKAFRLPETPASSFDADLLGQQPPRSLQQIFQWVEWAQAVVPALDTATSGSGRGRDVSFRREELPSLEIQKLTLVGVSSVGDQYYRLMGSINNLSNRPHAQRYPASLSLRAQGDHHVIVNGLYDQRNGNRKSYFSIRSLDLTREEGLALLSAQQRVGLPIQVTPGKYAAQLNLNLDGEKLDGQLLVRHTQTRVDCDLSQVKDPALAARMRDELQSIESYVVTYELNGTTDKIVATSKCDLGLQIAQALDNSTQFHFASTAQQQSLAVRQSLQEHQQRLHQWVDQEAQQIMVAVQHETSRIASLQDNAQSNDTLRLR